MTILSRKIINLFLAISLVASTINPGFIKSAQAQTLLDLPAPGTMVTTSPVFNPAIVAGITLYPNNPLQFDFIIDPGDDHLQGQSLSKESQKLINYFMATLTIPEDEMWVNLSPYEKDRIIAKGLGDTELGRDMLAQDYILKQLTASLMYPEDESGSEFWNRVYKKAREQFGTSEIPVNTFNKVWIIPESATVYENDNTVYIVKSHLKVLLEEDYLALQNNKENAEIGTDQLSETQIKDSSSISSQIIREILLPEIEKEVNQGKNFASLRQIYHSMILATWYKNNLKESLLGQVYVNQNKIEGVAVEDKQIKNKIYNQYVEAFKKGVYDYIKEDYDEASQQVIPRKYFSGGEDFAQLSDDAMSDTDAVSADSWLGKRSSSPMVRVKARSYLSSGDAAMLATEITANLEKENLSRFVRVQEENGNIEFVSEKETFEDEERGELFRVINNSEFTDRVFNGIQFEEPFDLEYAKVSLYKALFQAYVPKSFTNPHREWSEFLEVVDGGEKKEGSIFANQEHVTKIQNLQQNPYYEQYGAWFRKVQPLLDGRKKPKILIIGPGSGNSVRKARDALPDAEITALDVEPEVIERLRDQGFDINLVVGDGVNTPFADQSFDIVTVEGVLRYVATRGQDVVDQFAKELKRLIKNDGIIYIHDGLITQLMNEFSETLGQQGLETRNTEQQYSAHRHTIFRILYYEYFIKNNRGIKSAIDEMMRLQGVEQSETIAFLFELAGYRPGVMNSIEAINSNNGAISMVDLNEVEPMAKVNEVKSFSIPADWEITPDKIVYDDNTDPTRTNLPTKYAVSVVMMNENGEVFFAKRNPKLGDVWSLPSSNIESEDDPNLLAFLKEKVQKSLGVEINEVELIGKRMGYRRNRDGSEWQLLMHVVFARSYSGEPHQTGYVHSTGQPKYTEMGFFNPRQFLTGEIGSFDLDTAGDCTKCFGTILHRGSYEEFETEFRAPKGPKGPKGASSQVGKEEGGSDSSMISAPGGIDLNSNNLNLKARGEQIKFQLPVNLQGLQSSHVDTVNTVIINIVPIVNFPLLIGLTDEKDKSTLARFN